MKRGVDYIGVGVGAIIQNDEGKFFAAKRGREAKNERGKWEFPGGSVEFGDTMEDTIVREMKEEHDIDIEVVELANVANHMIPDEKQHWVAVCFMCKIKSGEPKIMESHKCEEIGWFTLAELDQLSLSINTQHHVNELRKKGYE